MCVFPYLVRILFYVLSELHYLLYNQERQEKYLFLSKLRSLQNNKIKPLYSSKRYVDIKYRIIAQKWSSTGARQGRMQDWADGNLLYFFLPKFVTIVLNYSYTFLFDYYYLIIIFIEPGRGGGGSEVDHAVHSRLGVGLSEVGVHLSMVVLRLYTYI